ncbi:MAG: thiamine pyrophosphate-dependent enzyme [Ilumatobacteraceae bacterium]
MPRRPSLAASTAGPGVTNGISAVTSAMFNGAPLVVLGGRAPEGRWGAGSLQEFDHVPVLAPITKLATTVKQAELAGEIVHGAATLAASPHLRPGVPRLPVRPVRSTEGEVPDGGADISPAADPASIEVLARLVAGAERPAFLVGSDATGTAPGTSSGRGDIARRAVLLQRARPRHAAGRPLARSFAPQAAEATCRPGGGDRDPARLPGRLRGFGDASPTSSTTSRRRPGTSSRRRSPVTSPSPSPALANYAGDRVDHTGWLAELRDAEEAAAPPRPRCSDRRSVVKPTRIYGELRKRLDRDAIVICDGGDFVSYAGKYVEVHQPGGWLDTGPYGCLGNGMGYAIAARTVHPDRQIVVMLGDGAAGFSLMDVDSLVRHGLPVVMVVGNNGIWGAREAPDADDLRLGHGVRPAARDPLRRGRACARRRRRTVTSPDEIGPALDRAFASGVPYLVNVMTDPGDVYPRTSNLAWGRTTRRVRHLLASDVEQATAATPEGA